MVDVLDKFPECFSTTPGFCGKISHKIVVNKDFVPKRLKAYAVIWALTKYRHWLFANEVVVFSDNNPLVFLTESVPKAPKLLRWALALQQFNCTFKYKVDKTNVADCLSRPVGIRE